MTSIRHATMAVGLATLLVLSGCGNSAVPKKAAAEDSSTEGRTGYPTQKNKACDILTQEIAKSLLGGVAEESEPVKDTGNADVKISSCVRASSLSKLARSGAVSLVMRVAQNSTGARTNAEGFATDSMPESAQDVPGYGEKAFWNPALGQLNILEGGNWYVLASGPIDPRKHTLADTKKLADAIIDQL